MKYSNGGPPQPHRDDVSAMPGEGLDAWVRRVRRFAVVDPGLLARERDRLAGQAQQRGELAERSRQRMRIAARWLAGSLLALCVSLVLHALTGLSSWVAVACAVACGVGAGAAAFSFGPGRSGSTVPALAPGRSELVRIAELDGLSRELLARVQQAIDQVLSSTVYHRNLLDQSAGDAVLRRHEWETAAAVREITSLRAALDASPVEGPKTAAVLESQRRALAIAQDHMAARVGAIEKYAAQVKAADAALRDCKGAIRAAGLNARYLDLVARTAADEHAIEEMTGLTEQAAAAAQAFQDSLRLADQAGAALVFPDEAAGSAEPDPSGQTRATS